MPSEKRKDFEDTWAPEELHKSLKKDDRKRSSTRDRDRERKKDESKKHGSKDEERKDKDKANRDRERRHRDKENEEKANRDRERRHRDKENEEKKPRDRDRDRDKDRERRKRHEDDNDKDKKRPKDESSDRRRHRDDKDKKERDDRKRERKDRDDKERRRHRDDKPRDDRRGKDEESRHRRHREDDGERKCKSKGPDRRKREEEIERRKKEKDEHLDSDSDEGDKKKSSKTSEQSNNRRLPSQCKRVEAGDNDYEDDFEDYEDDFEDEDEENENGNDSDPDRNEDEGDHSNTVINKPKDKELSLDLSGSWSSSKSPGYLKSFDWDPQNTMNNRGGDRVQEFPIQARESREEMDDILKAMNEENDRLLKSHKPKRREADTENDKSSTRPTTGSRKTFINFVSAKQRQVTMKAASKAARRGRELLQMLDLDFAGYDMFDMPPVNEYELYMRTYGQSDMKQAYVQTNEDNIERDIQTEEIESSEKWTQHPPEDIRGSGGGEDSDVDVELGTSKPVDSIKLSKFVTRAGTEEKAQGSSGSMTQRKSNVCVSEGFVDLTPCPLLQGRYVSNSCISAVQSHLLLTVFTESQLQRDSQNPVSGKGIVCVWNLNEPSRPNHILVCEGRPQCCCFSPVKPTLAFAGMHDGSLAVWDLREPMSLHRMVNFQDQSFLLRYPTYNTAHVMVDASHLSAIVSVAPIVAANDSMIASIDSTDADVQDSSSFQLASLEENAKIHLWVVAELSHPDPAGSQSDFGLLPGGRVKLIKSSSIALENPNREARMKSGIQAFDMAFNPRDPSHYYIATDTGCVIHGVRYGGKAPPKAYKGELDVSLEIVSLDFSPFTEPVFLCGCKDGSLRLYSTKSEKPLLSLPDVTGGRPIKCVRWCRSRPSVFFVLDESSHLQIWDLNMSDGSALRVEQISQERVTSFTLSNDHSATGLGTPGRGPQMVVCLESGAVEIHTVSKEFSALMSEEVDQFASYLESIK